MSLLRLVHLRQKVRAVHLDLDLTVQVVLVRHLVVCLILLALLVPVHLVVVHPQRVSHQVVPLLAVVQ